MYNLAVKWLRKEYNKIKTKNNKRIKILEKSKEHFEQITCEETKHQHEEEEEEAKDKNKIEYTTSSIFVSLIEKVFEILGNRNKGRTWTIDNVAEEAKKKEEWFKGK